VLNTRHPALKDKRVRQALNFAVNKEAILRDILRGTAIVATSPLSPVYGAFHEPNTSRYPFNPERAKTLLREAGYPNGLELTFLVPESGSGMQSPVEMATVIQANLTAVGVKAKIQTMEWGAYLKKYLDGPDMAEMSWNPSIGCRPTASRRPSTPASTRTRASTSCCARRAPRWRNRSGSPCTARPSGW